MQEDKIQRHLHNLPRAKPPEGFFGKIESRLGQAKVVVLADWRQFAAAAVLIVALNVAALVQYSQYEPATSPGVASVENPLVSDYEIYY